MVQPLPLEILSPTGVPLYLNPYSGAYSANKAYARRMQRNYARGLSQSAARGHRPSPAGLTESQIRRQRSIEQTGLTPWQRFTQGFQQRVGIEYNKWARWQRLYIREINALAFPTARSRNMQFNDFGQRDDPRVFMSDIIAVRDLYQQGFRDPAYNPDTWEEWVEHRLRQRLAALTGYHDAADILTGRTDYNARQGSWSGPIGLAAAPPIELWYYH